MNSEPSRRKTGTVDAIRSSADADRERPVPEHEAADGLVDREQDAADRVALLGVVASDRPPCSRSAPGSRGRNVNGSMRVKSMRSAGSSVIASTAAIAMARFFEYASGLKSRPSWSTSVNTGRNATRDHEQREEDRRADLLERAQADLVEVALAPARDPFLEPLVGVLHLDDGAVDQHADRDGDARRAT